MAHAQYLTYDEYKAYGGALAPAAYPPMGAEKPQTQ